MWLKDIPDLLGLQVGKQSVFTEADGSYRNVLLRSLWKSVATPRSERGFGRPEN